MRPATSAQALSARSQAMVCHGKLILACARLLTSTVHQTQADSLCMKGFTPKCSGLSVINILLVLLLFPKERACQILHCNFLAEPLEPTYNCYLDCVPLPLPNDTRATALEVPPYAISNGNALLPLGSHTIPVTAQHKHGELEYNAHNLCAALKIPTVPCYSWPCNAERLQCLKVRCEALSCCRHSSCCDMTSEVNRH